MAEIRGGGTRETSQGRASVCAPARSVRRAANAPGGVGGRHSTRRAGKPRTGGRPSTVSAVPSRRFPHAEEEPETYAGRERIAAKARTAPRERFTALAHHLTEEFLRETFSLMNRRGAPGVDGVSMTAYGQHLDAQVADLVARLKRRAYQAPPVRRVYIPKSGKPDQLRPLGIPAGEDRLLQAAVARLLSALYEPLFRDTSYGFRPSRSAHGALRRVRQVVMSGRVQYVYEADIRGFFDHLDHAWLLRMLALRVGDPRILGRVRQWLQAGVLDQGRTMHPEAGTPQGGPLSPVLANVYRHYVLDLWFDRAVRPRLRGTAELVR